MASWGWGGVVVGRGHEFKRKIALWSLLQCPLQWRHNERPGVSNHRRRDCLLNRLFRLLIKKTSKPASLAFVRVDSPHKGSVTRKSFPLDHVIMSRNTRGFFCIAWRVTRPDNYNITNNTNNNTNHSSDILPPACKVYDVTVNCIYTIYLYHAHNMYSTCVFNPSW